MNGDPSACVIVFAFAGWAESRTGAWLIVVGHFEPCTVRNTNLVEQQEIFLHRRDVYSSSELNGRFGVRCVSKNFFYVSLSSAP